MERVREPELMDDPEQVQAYAEADFSVPHGQFITEFERVFPKLAVTGSVLDLGCGPADITVRFAQTFPQSRLDGVDGAGTMLGWARQRIQWHGLDDRIRLVQSTLPSLDGLANQYNGIISNSLLHHLADPRVLWETVKALSHDETFVFIMDLLRPDSVRQAERLVSEYAAEEPAILQRDFFQSLRAAFTLDEVKSQLGAAGLHRGVIEQVSDRHFIVFRPAIDSNAP